MGGLCGGARPAPYNPYGYGAQSTGCCGTSSATGGCCGCGQPAPVYYPQVQQPGLVASTVGAPVEVIETVTTTSPGPIVAPPVFAPPPMFAPPPPQIISAPAPIFSPPPRPLGGTMISGPTIAGPPISVPTAHTIGLGPPAPLPLGVGGVGGVRTSVVSTNVIGGPGFGGPGLGGPRPGFGGPIGGFGGPIGGPVGFGGPIGGPVGFGGPIGGPVGFGGPGIGLPGVPNTTPAVIRY
jgi:hypothetical protein